MKKERMMDNKLEEKHKISNSDNNSDNNSDKIQREIKLDKETFPLREMDASLIRWLGVLAEKDIYEDLYSEEEWQVNLYRVGEIFGKLRIDLNRDGIWDEEWILKDDEVIRMTTPDYKGNFKEYFMLERDRWNHVS